MGCENSHLSNDSAFNHAKISIVDSAFMKQENEGAQKEIAGANIDFDYFVSLDCFFEEFSKRYYNNVVTCQENYKQLVQQLQKLSFSPNIFIIIRGKRTEESLPFNVKQVKSYTELIKELQEKEIKPIKSSEKSKNTAWKNSSLKILTKPGAKTSEQAIFEAALAKANITYEFYNSFQLLEQSIAHSLPQFIVTDYIYHREVIELSRSTKIKVFCYCSFDKNESYSPDVYSLSNNYLDITQDIKKELKLNSANVVKCSKAYLYINELSEYDEIQYQIEKFNIEIRPFNNMEKVIKETTYFFCVTVLAAESEIKSLTKFFQKNDYLHRVKLISLSKNLEPTLKHLFKTIRLIKKGYHIEKTVTNSIDIIDKHYDNVKFEQIKKELEANNISCHGFTNLSTYIKTKKFISPFIICNFEEKLLLLKYMKQLQCKAKIIIFCNKNKIKEYLKDNKNFSFISSHFGKIIKFIRKTTVYVPILDREEDSKFNEKIEKIKSKNRRISALKWGMVGEEKGSQEASENLQFLNISEHTNNASIREIEKSVAMLWKLENKIIKKPQNFKKDFSESLKELKTIYQIQYPENQFQNLLEKIKASPLTDLMSKIKEYFESENQFGVQINKSLIKTESLPKKHIESLRQFLFLIFLNYSSPFSVPRTAKLQLQHWMSNQLIQKCQVGSYLLCKNFLIAYENSNSEHLSKIKLQIDIEYNPLTESDLYFSPFITHKDKYIFSPFSKFKIQEIRQTGLYKVIKLKNVKNVDFLKYIFAENIVEEGSNLQEFHSSLLQKGSSLVDESCEESVKINLKRFEGIEKFRKGEVEEAIKIHKNLISICQEQQNLNSVLVNELNYELACFYLKGENLDEAATLMKDLLGSNPGEYIKQQCEILIDQTLKNEQNDDKQNQKEEDFKKKSTKKITHQAMKTFIWMKEENKSDKDDSLGDSDDEEELAMELDEGVNIFDQDLPCIEIDENFKEVPIE